MDHSPDRDPNVVLRWLGRDSAGAAYHLAPLNLTWSSAGVEADLAVFEGVARRLSSDPELWSVLLKEPNWRFTLVGCVCLLVQGSREHFADLSWRLEQGSWVAPQLAVTMGLLNPELAGPALRELLEGGALEGQGRSMGAVRFVLERLEPSCPEPAHAAQGQEDALEGARVAQKLWDFWRGRLGPSSE